MRPVVALPGSPDACPDRRPGQFEFCAPLPPHLLAPLAPAVTQTIKDVLQSLVDDNMVTLEKIGAKNFYYAFPSTTYRALMNKSESLAKELEGDRERTERALAEVAALEAEREDTEERRAAEERLAALAEEEAAIHAQLKIHADKDPAVVEELMDKVLTCKQAADRWTDNVWALKSFCVTKCNTEPKAFDRLVGITDSFDYVE